MDRRGPRSARNTMRARPAKSRNKTPCQRRCHAVHPRHSNASPNTPKPLGGNGGHPPTTARSHCAKRVPHPLRLRRQFDPQISRPQKTGSHRVAGHTAGTARKPERNSHDKKACKKLRGRHSNHAHRPEGDPFSPNHYAHINNPRHRPIRPSGRRQTHLPNPKPHTKPQKCLRGKEALRRPYVFRRNRLPLPMQLLLCGIYDGAQHGRAAHPARRQTAF